MWNQTQEAIRWTKKTILPAIAMIVTDANLLWKRNARAKTASWRIILKTNQEPYSWEKKLWKREASQWRLWTPLRTNINFFFRGISTTKVDWKIMDPTCSNQNMVKLQLSGTWKKTKTKWHSICLGKEAPILTMAQEGTTRILDANYDITDLEKKVNPCDLSYKKRETCTRSNSLYWQ